MADSYCVSCGVITSDFGSPKPASHLCAPCFEYHTQNNSLPTTEVSDTGHLLPDEDTRLKVFKIRVWKVSNIGKTIVDEIVALGKDEDSVTKLVFGNLGYDIRGQVFDVNELHGPWGEGYILSQW